MIDMIPGEENEEFEVLDADQWLHIEDHEDIEEIYLSIWDELSNCLVPVLLQASLKLLPTIVMSGIIGQLMQWRKQHVPRGGTTPISILLGMLVLFSLVDYVEAIGVFLFFLVLYIPMPMATPTSLKSSYFYFCYCSFGLLYLVYREQYPMFKENNWPQVRGIVMIGYMKAVSVFRDLQMNLFFEMPSFENFLSYMVSPATVAFGPWTTYKCHLKYLMSFNSKTNYRRWFFQCIKRIFYVYLYLIISTCGLEIFGKTSDSTYFEVYRDAMTVRFSHYFICQMAELTYFVGGPRTPKDKLMTPVVKVGHVELPRSLVDVVVFWNIPMHYWLKKHVYNPVSAYGKSLAIMITFLASAMLHGLNIPLSIVLLTIGFYCHVEYQFRETLSTLTSSCVRARACVNCKHRNTMALPVYFVNFGFHLLALYNLAYLGIMLQEIHEGDMPRGLKDEMQYRLERWQKLDFSSHGFMTGMFIVVTAMKFMYRP